MSSAVPTSWRTRRCSDSSFRPLNTAQATAVDRTAQARTPTFASSSVSPENARLATSSDTVKPMPAVAAPPASTAHPAGRRRWPGRSVVISQVAPRMPTGFPIT